MSHTSTDSFLLSGPLNHRGAWFICMLLIDKLHQRSSMMDQLHQCPSTSICCCIFGKSMESASRRTNTRGLVCSTRRRYSPRRYGYVRGL